MSNESPYERFVRETGIKISRATYYRIRAELSDDSQENRLNKIVEAEKTGLYEQAAEIRKERERQRLKARHEREKNKIPF